MVEGQATHLVERLPAALAQQFGEPVPIRHQSHGRYGTAELELELPAPWGGAWLVDLASARRERYPRLAENPVVAAGTLEQDLARRDFSVNAMALELVAAGLAEATLLDPYGGQGDLAQRHLQLLHPQSLQDDPTRLLRAARYGARLGFALAAPSQRQVQTTLAEWPWPWRPGDPLDRVPAALGTRLRMELELLLEREPWPAGLALLQAWGGLVLLDRELQADRAWRRRLVWGQRLGLPRLPLLLLGSSSAVALARRLQLPQGQQRLLEQTLSLRRRVQEALASGTDAAAPPSTWCQLLEAPGASAEAVAMLLASGVQPRRPLLHWWARWRHVGPPLDGAALLRQGWSAGPRLGEELRRLRAERLDRRNGRRQGSS